MISTILSRLVILVFGTLYPAYASYKAVRTKNVKEYVKWMMYWIVFALFTCIETFTDVFLSWFPFYYEIKIVLVIWLLSPATKGSSILYRKFVHPMLSSKEQEIDEYINKAKEQSYRQVLDLGSKGVSALMQTAIKGGGGIVNQLKKSYSLSDLTDPTLDEGRDEADDVLITDPRLIRRRRSPHRSASSTSSLYFREAEVRSDRITSIQSAEDISSGYSSGEACGQPAKLLARETIHRTGSLTRSRTTRASKIAKDAQKKSTGTGSEDSDNDEVFDHNIIFLNGKAKQIDKLLEESSSEGEFQDSLEGDDKTIGELFPKKKPPDLTACGRNQVNLDGNVVGNNSETLTKTQPVSYSHSNNTEEKSLDLIDLNLEKITKDVDTFSNFVQQMIEAKIEEKPTQDESQLEQKKKKSIPKEEFEDVNLVQNSNEFDFEDARGGKYNKKAAPPPPKDPKEALAAPPIKATLILKPGVLKTLGRDDSTKEIFVQSPKTRRKQVNKSPSSVSTMSAKSKSSLSRLIKLPKLPFLNKDQLTVPNVEVKRFSWHSFFKENTGRTLVDTKLQSKSENDLSVVSVKSLKDSPLAHRRLKIIRRFLDEDID